MGLRVRNRWSNPRLTSGAALNPLSASESLRKTGTSPTQSQREDERHPTWCRAHNGPQRAAFRNLERPSKQYQQ